MTSSSTTTASSPTSCSAMDTEDKKLLEMESNSRSPDESLLQSSLITNMDTPNSVPKYDVDLAVQGDGFFEQNQKKSVESEQNQNGIFSKFLHSKQNGTQDADSIVLTEVVEERNGDKIEGDELEGYVLVEKVEKEEVMMEENSCLDEDGSAKGGTGDGVCSAGVGTVSVGGVGTEEEGGDASGCVDHVLASECVEAMKEEEGLSNEAMNGAGSRSDVPSGHGNVVEESAGKKGSRHGGQGGGSFSKWDLVESITNAAARSRESSADCKYTIYNCCSYNTKHPKNYLKIGIASTL